MLDAMVDSNPSRPLMHALRVGGGIGTTKLNFAGRTQDVIENNEALPKGTRFSKVLWG